MRWCSAAAFVLLIACRISVLSAGAEAELLEAARPQWRKSSLEILAPWSGQAVALGGEVEVAVRVTSFHESRHQVSCDERVWCGCASVCVRAFDIGGR
jgi:hypothetical protein